ncbi:plexin domain-containing protein 1-like [Haemaphysalis longicornis]
MISFVAGTSFVVEWHQVVLQDKPDGGNYTFQAVLHKSGDIVFIYKDVSGPSTAFVSM